MTPEQLFQFAIGGAGIALLIRINLKIGQIQQSTKGNEKQIDKIWLKISDMGKCIADLKDRILSLEYTMKTDP